MKNRKREAGGDLHDALGNGGCRKVRKKEGLIRERGERRGVKEKSGVRQEIKVMKGGMEGERLCFKGEDPQMTGQLLYSNTKKREKGVGRGGNMLESRRQKGGKNKPGSCRPRSSRAGVLEDVIQ